MDPNDANPSPNGQSPEGHSPEGGASDSPAPEDGRHPGTEPSSDGNPVAEGVVPEAGGPDEADATLAEAAPVKVKVVRPRRILWDRVKILLALGALWGALLWGAVSSNPLLSWNDALANQVSAKWWLEVLLGLEVLRQISYLTEERSPRWHRTWSGLVHYAEARRLRLSDWTRYRIGRVIRVVFLIVLVAIIAGAVTHEAPITAFFQLPGKAYKALPMLFQVVVILLLSVGQIFAIFWFLSRGGTDVYFPDDIKTRFSDVWGQDAVLERVKESLVFLENPGSIEERGGHVPSGILLWGPPGTGKTLMAEALAGETGKPYVFVDPGAFTNMFMGVGILKVKTLFRKLRRLAVRYGGVIVFFDEADSLGNRGALTPGGVFRHGSDSARAFASTGPWSQSCHGSGYTSPQANSLVFASHLHAAQAAAGPSEPGADRQRSLRAMVMGGAGGGGMGTLQALLTEMSGLKKPRGFMNRVVRRVLGTPPKDPPKYRIMVVMATNMPQALDEALLRPGRIDRIYKVGYPSKNGRVRTYQGYFDKVAHNLTAGEIEKLAVMTPYATGATMKDLVNESLIMAIRDGRSRIEWTDVLSAKRLKALGPPEDVEYIERERHAVAVHEACHAITAYRVARVWSIDMATIEMGNTYLGKVDMVRPEDTFTVWRSDYEADIMVCLASLAGERMFFGGDNSSGVSGDLESATHIASRMEGYWGMGSTIAVHGVTHGIGAGGGGGKGKDEETDSTRDLLKGSLGERIEGKLARLFEQVEALLAENRREILSLAHALEVHKTLSAEDVFAVIEGTRGPVVDGTRYLDSRFMDMAEEYHEQIVNLHQNRDKAKISLFTLDDLAPVPALEGSPE